MSSSTIETAKKPDGTTINFVKKAPMQGGLKDVYFTEDRNHVVAFYRDPLDAVGKARLDNLVGRYRDGIYNQKGSQLWRELFCWPESIVTCDGQLGLLVPSYDKRFFFGPDTNLDGAEKDGKWFASAKVLNRFVPPQHKGNLLGYLKICLNLSRAVRRLHAAGLAHSDLSYKNCLVDPITGSACIIDIDGLVVPGLFPTDVIGTADFIAPEVVATQTLPRQTVRRGAAAPRP